MRLAMLVDHQARAARDKTSVILNCVALLALVHL
jgi:hypothetical protein